MGTNRLQIYQDALLLCKQRFLASLSEDCEARRLLDNVWTGGGVKNCLEQGQWQFAMRSVMIDSDPDITPEFGYQYAFGKPTDWVLTSALCSDERFRVPITGYRDEISNWTTDVTPIYVQYVSNDDAFGNNLALWPQTFCDFVAAFFASKVVGKLTSDDEIRQEILRPTTGALDRTRLIAKNRAAMTQATQYPATGSWVRARTGRFGRGPMGDGGTSGL